MAETSNPFWGTAEKLLFVTDTQFEGSAGAHALCVEVTDTHAFFVPTERVVGRYVFSKSKCTTPDILPVAAERIPMLKAAGILPASVSDTPTAPLPPSYLGKISLGLGAMLLAGLGWVIRRPMRKASRRISAISGDPLFFDVLQTVMFHTARTDGVIEKSELQSIMQVYADVTGTPLTPDMAAAKFAQSITDDAVVNLAKPYRGDQALLLLDAAVRVATHNGAITREKKVLLKGLGNSLQQDTGQLRSTIATRLENHRQLEPA